MLHTEGKIVPTLYDAYLSTLCSRHQGSLIACCSHGFHDLQVNDQEWIDQVVKGEDIVQREDMHMCDLVQKGLASPAYDVGR